MIQNFLHIETVPQYKDLIDIALSKTNRKTPTVVRAGYQIHRIRNFYVRKVKFASSEFVTRLCGIIRQFPVLEDLHPFYTDLIGLLYDRDHYKIALGRVNSAKQRIEVICKEHLKLINYGDSLYRCKELKRAALGKMASTAKKLSEPLKYLEEVRQHMSRLPSIDTSGRTLIVCGMPNVGKSSFMNIVSRAHVEVQSYAFTTKSIFIGHFDYQDLRWQVLDTPGILDRILEDRNSIEMLTITALAHLRSAVLFLMDLSETCGFTIEEQISLYESLSPLLRAQILIVFTKADIKRLEDVRDDERLASFLKDKKYTEMSAVKEYNVEEARTMACDMLLKERFEDKQERIDKYIHRIKPVLVKGEMNERDEQAALGTSCFAGMHENETYFCDNKYDVIPEMYFGKNIADFIDPQIGEKFDDVEMRDEDIRRYDILNRDERELLQACNNARINANMRAKFNARATMPASWKNKVTTKGEIVADIKRAVPVVRKEPQHVDKKVSRTENKRYYDMSPRHIYRPTGSKHKH